MSSTVVRLTIVIFCSLVPIASPASASTDPSDGTLTADTAAVRRAETSASSRVALATSAAADAAIRTSDPIIAAALVQASYASPTFQALLDRLRASDLVVYVQTRYELPSSMDGQLTFVGTGGNRRYVLVSLGWGRSDQRLIGTLAHELQHAVEVAERSDIVDSASLGRAYESLGQPRIRGTVRTFETQRAIDAGARVLAEVTEIKRSAKAAPEAEIRP